ncbi:MAG: hypothetical protein ACJ8FY_18565 [Gemmataceae bacterium]
MAWQTQKKPILGKVTDAFGVRWDIGKIRPTRHGFPILLGWRQGHARGRCFGRSSVILTRALARYLKGVRANPAKADLPICFASIVNLRKRLGHHWTKDRRRWWEERQGDLSNLTEPQFAKKYRRKSSVVRYARIRVVGRIRRREGWWQTDETLAVLRSAQTHRIAAKELGISLMTVRRLRDQAKSLKDRS